MLSLEIQPISTCANNGCNNYTLPILSLPQLLTGGNADNATGMTVNSDGTLQLTGSGIPIAPQDAVVRNVTAQTATLSASGNLTLVESQLLTKENLNLLATGTVRIRDSTANPFIAQAGDRLFVQGNSGIDIFALNHPASGFFSNGDMVFRANTVGGDAHYTALGNFQIEKLDGSPGNLSSPYDPIIRANGDVTLGNYTGASLHILAGGKVNIGNVTITGADTVANSLAEQVTISNGTIVSINGNTQPTLDIRAGIDWNQLGGLPGNTFSS